ncbi:MAG: hypothetical protein ACREI8_03855 [Myxococcota bacterium]
MVRWLVRIVVGLVVLVALVFVGARLHDGPLGPIPGGPLASGEIVSAPVTDWSFAKDVAETELQLESQDRSRTVWILVNGAQAYVPCSLGFPPGKSWYQEAVKDGRATLRIEGKRYPVTLSKLDDAAQAPLTPVFEAEVARKYGNPPSTDAGVWFFHVTSR